MQKLIVDTTKLRESGKDLLALTKELNEELNVFFERITNIGIKTNEWSGISKQNFVMRTNSEKIYYNKILNTLVNYSKILTTAADEYDTHVRNLR